MWSESLSLVCYSIKMALGVLKWPFVDVGTLLFSLLVMDERLLSE